MSGPIDIPRMLKLLGIEATGRDELWACCPHHMEKTPSWSIKAETGGHHCFGCKWGGIAEDVVVEKFDLSGRQAARTWIQDKGLYLKLTAPAEARVVLQRPKTRQALEMLRLARFGVLDTWPTPARRYAERRGITPEQIDTWNIGYVVGGDFNGRLFFPIYNRAGELRSFTTRTFINQGPRYKNPTPVADNGAIFGEVTWPTNLAEQDLVLCEGAINALACERVGAKCVAALGGSWLHKEQVLKLGRFGSITLAADSDVAGEGVAKQIIGALGRWKPIRRIQFPLHDARALDPCDIERDDPEKLRDLLWGNGVALDTSAISRQEKDGASLRYSW